jgi:citrate lyase subunit beta/citryl-CoA lyase
MMRSWLFAPGNHPRRMEKALSLGADVSILDLEDACPEAEKDGARGLVRAALEHPRRGLAYVRINAVSTGRAEADLQAIVGAGLDGVMLPKAERRADLEEACRHIGLLERRRGLAEGEIDLVPLIETAVGLEQARALAEATPRVRRFAFGSVDFSLDLGLEPGPDELELMPYRAMLVLAAKTAGLQPPIDSACMAIDDEVLMAQAARRSRAMGFGGKICIHPSQVDAVNAAFAPGEQERAKAARIVEAFEAAEARGSAAIQVDGELVDYPVFRRAKQMLAAATPTSAA